MAIGAPTEEERVALCEWLSANDIDPKTVPIDCKLSISDGVIRFEQHVLTDGGQMQIDPADSSRVWKKQATAPCRVQPPAWLKIPGATS